MSIAYSIFTRAERVFAGKRFDLADGKYSILPMPADHDPASSPLLYSIMETATGKRMLYAHDTGLLPEQTWQLLKQEGRYDLISLDCTGGDDENEWVKDHLCLRTCLIVLRKMKEYGIVDDRSKIVLNHFTHNAKQTYDEMKIIADRYGLIVSYDGLEVAF